MKIHPAADRSSGGGSPLKAIIICQAVVVLGLAMAILPFIFNSIEKAIGDGAFAMVLVGGFFAVTAFFSSFVFLHRLGVYRDLFQEDRLLAHWRYSEREWRAYSDSELAAEASVKRLLVMITAAFALLYCGLMALLHPELVALMIGVAFTIIALMAGAAALSYRLSRLRNLTATVEARIGRRGLWLNGALHAWSGGGSYLVDCSVDEAEEPKCLVFSYATIERHGAQVHQVRVPIPDAHLSEAQRIIASLAQDFRPVEPKG